MVSDDEVRPAYLVWKNDMIVCGIVFLPHEAFKAGAAWMTDVSRGTLEGRIERYREAMADRDQLIKDLKAEQWPITRIASCLTLGRSTVSRVLGAQWHYNHGRRQTSNVSPKSGNPDATM